MRRIALFTSSSRRFGNHFLSVLVAFSFQMGLGAAMVVETAREISLAYDVDVVVAGGSLAGVEAARAAADRALGVTPTALGVTPTPLIPLKKSGDTCCQALPEALCRELC